MAARGPACPLDPLATLLERASRGDDDAFRELHELTCVRVSRVVLAVLRSPAHSAEVVQEVYLHVWQHAAAFDPARGSTLAWLLTIARRRAVDRVRHVASTARREEQDAAARDQVAADSAEAGLARHEATRLRAAVTRLSVLQREAVALTYLHGYSNLEAATFLQIPLGTLKTRVRAGVISLRRQYEADAA